MFQKVKSPILVIEIARILGLEKNSGWKVEKYCLILSEEQMALEFLVGFFLKNSLRIPKVSGFLSR